MESCHCAQLEVQQHCLGWMPPDTWDMRLHFVKFFPAVAEIIACTYGTYPRRDGQAEWACVNTGIVDPAKVTDPNTNQACCDRSCYHYANVGRHKQFGILQKYEKISHKPYSFAHRILWYWKFHTQQLVEIAKLIARHGQSTELCQRVLPNTRRF